MFLLSKCTDAESKTDNTGFYKGYLDNKYAITISLKQTGNIIYGFYHYDKNKIDIRLHGKVDKNGDIQLEEYGYFEITGYWNGKIIDRQFSGKWISGDNKRNISFICTEIELQSMPGEPLTNKIAFGEKEINPTKSFTAITNTLGKELFDELVSNGMIDKENEYEKEIVEIGIRNPSILFTGENVDLNNDGTHELIVKLSGDHGACRSHNCPIWIFHTNGGTYKKILEASVGVFGYKILDMTNNNFNDVVLIEHSSAIEHEYTVFRYMNDEYQQYRCFTQSSRENKNGTINSSFKEHKCNN